MLADKHTRLSGGNSMVYTSVKKYALMGLSDLIRVLMENIDDALFGLSEKAESDSERHIYFEAMREIRLKRTAIQLGFDQAMEACFDELTHKDTSNVVQLEADELSLVELEDIEDNIAIDNMISKARPSFEDDLFAVLERLKAVLQSTEIDADANPFDPKAICNSFHQASDILDTDIQVKLIFYKLFDKYVMSNLGHFYSEMNEFFIQKGVLPEFKASAERLKQSTNFLTNRIKHSDQSNDLSISEDPGSPGTLAEIPGSNVVNTEGGLLAVLQQALSGGASGVTGITGSSGESGQTSASHSVSGNAQGADISILPIAQNAAFMSALTNLQTANIADQSPLNTDPQSYKQEMHQQLVAFGQETQHQTNASDNQIIDIVSMLFDFFLDDESLPDPVKVLIGRLQIPILKAAIIDNNFFNLKKHPARQLLDDIARASLGWNPDSAQEKLLIDKIESVVNFILTQFDDDIGVFDTALRDFNEFINAENEKIQLADEAVMQQEVDQDRLISDAQNAAAALIAKVCKNRDLPFEVSDFLDTVWNSVLFHTYLSLGESSNHWKKLRRITSTLIWTLEPKFSEDERLKILKTLPALLRALSKGMELVKISKDQQNRIYQMLAQEHARVVKQTTKNIVTRIDDKTVWPDDDHIADAFANLTKTSEVIDIVSDGGMDDLPQESETDPDSVTEISITATSDVIYDLEQFTASVNKGDIEVDEEIIMGSAEPANFHASPTAEEDNFLEQAQAIEIGTWVEFMEPESQSVNTRLSWKSNVTGKMVFVNRQGAKVKNMSANALAMELRAERARFIQSASVFDRAINTIMTTIKH